MSEPIRALYILDNFPDPHAGTEGQFWLLFRNLSRERIDPAILLLRPSAFLAENVAPSRLRVLNVYRLLSLRSIAKVIGAVLWARRSAFQVAHIFFNDSSIVFPIPLRVAGIKVIVSRRDLGFWYTSSNLRLLRLAGKLVHRVVANCEAVRDVVIRKEKVSADRVDVVYNGLIRSPDRASIAAREDYSLPESARLVVIVANLRPIKRIDTAVEMLARVQATSDAHLLVVGEDRPANGRDSLQAELQEQARRLGVSDKLHFLGKMPDPTPIVAMSDVCVLCSESEGLSNTVIEYMLAGKPIVCTDVGGNAELIEEGRTGYLVPVGDVDALTRAVADLLTTKERALSFGERARERALAMFSSRAMVEKQTRIYESLVNQSRLEHPR